MAYADNDYGGDSYGYNDPPVDNPNPTPQAPWWIQNDYHAADREQVLKDPSRWGSDPSKANFDATIAKASTQPKATDYSGWTSVGHDGSYNGQSRDQWRDAWMGRGAMTPEEADAYLNANGAKQVNGKNGSWTTPFGDTLDLQIGRGAAVANGGKIMPGWTGQGGGGSGAGGAGAPGSGAGLGTGAGLPGGDGGMRDQLVKLLMERAGQSLHIDAANDPNIRAQSDPYAASVERMRRNYLADQAERQGPNANLTGEQRVTAEKAGQDIGLHESTLVGQEIAAKRAEIAHALDSERGMLTAEQQLALQKELTYLDDATKRLGIGTQNDQFMRGLGLQDWIAKNQDDYVRSGLRD